MVLIGVLVTHVVSGFSIFEAVNGVLTEYEFVAIPSVFFPTRVENTDMLWTLSGHLAKKG